MKKIKKTLLLLLTIFIVTSLFGCNLLQKYKLIEEDTSTNVDNNKIVELKEEEVDEEHSNFTLIISNQSFRKRVIRIKVNIDGKTAVNEEFDVKNQHNWLYFNYKLTLGKHKIEAISEDGVVINEVFEINNDEKKWILIDYWNEEGEKSKFSYNIDTKPFMFK